MLLQDAPTDVQAPPTRGLPPVRPPSPARDRQALWTAILAGVILLDVGLALWAAMSVKVALLILRMH